jgi:hypothetical protein
MFDDVIDREYKLIKKQLKLMKGTANAPEEHRERLMRLENELSIKTGLKTEAELRKRLENLGKLREEDMRSQKKIPENTALKCWFLRPLLSHLDHPGKINALSNPLMGIADLGAPVQLHIPKEWGLPEGRFDVLRRFFSWKGLGKGSAASRELEYRFFKSVEISHRLPFSISGITDLPLLHYNIDKLQKAAGNKNEQLSIVSGVCPLSLITDEIELEPDFGGLY